MRLHRITAILIATLSLAACGDSYEPPRALSAHEQAVVESSNSFGFDFFGQIVSDTPDSNVFVSPLSVSMALGMVYNGARDDTATGMATALAYDDLDLEQVNESYASLITLLTEMDPDVVLEIANAVWYREGLTVLTEFTVACVTHFSAAVEALDFADAGAVDTINDWVAEKTEGKIEEIIENIDPLTMMILTNAVYFKGDWTTQFDPNDTQSQAFHGNAGETQVEMMRSPKDLEISYTVTDTYQAARLPYGREHFAMTILVPREDNSIDDVLSALNPLSWSELQAAMSEQEITLYLPSFELEFEAILNSTLAALGMEEAFDEEAADFSGITTDLPLFISWVRHKTYVKVNEEGTEAAAVTAVGMDTLSMASEMRVDRPFIVVIHDTHSQSLLFMGRILDL